MSEKTGVSKGEAIIPHYSRDHNSLVAKPAPALLRAGSPWGF